MEPIILDTLPIPIPMADPRAELRGAGSHRQVRLSGDWIARRGKLPAETVDDILAAFGEAAPGIAAFSKADPGIAGLAIDAGELGHWDSALLSFVSDLRRAAAERGIPLDLAGLPPTASRLLALMPLDHRAPPAPRHTTLRFVAGRRALAGIRELREIAAMLGNAILGGGAALRGRAMLRRVDLLNCMRDAGASALPIVIIVNLLMGGILAFVGAVQLRRFGADVYVANLVGIAVVREIAALMTAIIMSGRTGGAYAAHIATMLGNEEIDALQAVGVKLSDYLILPRVVALTVMMPLLYLYGSLAGIFGGFLVAIAMLHLGPLIFIDHVQYAVAGSQIVFGLLKSVAFGLLIAITGCRIGLRAGRSAADVGSAATSAVVAGIVGVIVLDAVFAVCANALDF